MPRDREKERRREREGESTSAWEKKAERKNRRTEVERGKCKCRPPKFNDHVGAINRDIRILCICTPQIEEGIEHKRST